MKATISELWDTGREILSFDNDEFERPFDIQDLKKCDNVIIGNKCPHMGKGVYEVIIDNDICYVHHVRVKSRYMDFYGIEVYR